jgi:flagellar protein FliS
MPDPRRTYEDVGIGTASPERLLTLLWDRLLRDLDGALQGLVEGDLVTVNTALVHAQDIVFELRSSLRVDGWTGGAPLAALYEFVESELVWANVHKDAARIESCRELLSPLRDAFHEAARTAGAARAEVARSA